jgi:hypothetical protein
MSILLLLVEPFNLGGMDKTCSDLFFFVVENANVTTIGDPTSSERVDPVVQIFEQEFSLETKE